MRVALWGMGEGNAGRPESQHSLTRSRRIFALSHLSDFDYSFGRAICRGTGWGLGGFADEEPRGEDILALFGGNFCGWGFFGDGHF